MSHKLRLQYLQPNCSLTLRQAIMELRGAENAESDAAENVAEELTKDLDVHDAIHVLFACPTTLAGEVMAHVWTALGTTSKLADMHRVNRHRDHRHILAEIGHRRLVMMWIRSMPQILATFWRAWRMKRRWPVTDLALFLDSPLNELRKEFGISLRTPTQTKGGRGGAGLRSIRSKGQRAITA